MKHAARSSLLTQGAVSDRFHFSEPPDDVYRAASSALVRSALAAKAHALVAAKAHALVAAEPSSLLAARLPTP